MLDPDLVLTAVVTAFRSIPAVVSQMADDPNNIYAHFTTSGSENSVIQAVHNMTSPGVLVTYLDYLEGKFGAMGVWKHRLQIYIRGKNGASTVEPGASMPHIWWLMVNSPILGGPTNIRYTQLLSDPGVPGGLMIPDTPTMTRQMDETGADLIVATLVFPEWGDAEV